MIRAAGLRPPYDSLKLLGSGLGVACLVAVATVVVAAYHIDRYLPSKEVFRIYVWISAVSLAIAYSVARWVVGAERFDNLVGKVVLKIMRRPGSSV